MTAKRNSSERFLALGSFHVRHVTKASEKKRRKPQNIQAAFCVYQLSIDPIILIRRVNISYSVEPPAGP